MVTTAFGVLLAVTLCVASVLGVAGDCNPADQKALLAFKAQFNDPSGVLSSWSPTDPEFPDCCWWKGVTCELQAPNYPVTAVSLQGTDGVLTVKKGVTGAGNPLGNLPSLKFLVLSQVRFSFKYPVPPNWAKLSKLETLGLFDTQFVGTTLPSFLGTLPKLNDVTITGNRFPDGIPVLGLLVLESNGMKTIEKLALSLTKLKKLNNFFVANNAITGPIPTWVGKLALLTMPGKDIYLGGNKFTRPIPATLSMLGKSRFRPGNPGLCGKPLPMCPT